MTARLSLLITAASLLVLLAGLLLPRPSTLSLLATLPVAILLFTALRPPRRWGGWVAVCMIPYVCVAVGELIADPSSRANSTLVAVSSVCAFLAAMDYVRRTGTSLRR